MKVPNISFRCRLVCLYLLHFFILVVEPFDIRNVTTNLAHYAIASGVICLVIFLIFYFVVLPLFPSFFNSEKWTIGKHIFTIFLVAISIALLLWTYFRFLIPHNIIGEVSFSLILKLVFGIGFIPILIYFFIDEHYGRIARKKISKEVMQEVVLPQKKELKSEKKDSENLKVFAQNNKDFIEISIDNLLYINSKGNYTSFFIIENNQVKEKILRVSLVAVDHFFKNYSNIIRCHKSYIVNTNFITEVTGNARGYYFHLDDFEIEIPVSRKFNKEELLKSLQK